LPPFFHRIKEIAMFQTCPAGARSALKPLSRWLFVSAAVCSGWGIGLVQAQTPVQETSTAPAASSNSSNSSNSSSSGSGGLPLWEIGGFVSALNQQAYPGASQSIRRALVLPYVVYRGEYFRADRGSAGLRAFKTDNTELDIGFSAALGSASSEIEARTGMPDLGTLVEFGPRIKRMLGPGAGGGRWRADLALRGVFDLTDKFRDKGLALEPELIFERSTAGGMRYSTSVGLVLGDQRLADTFYSVSPEYATAQRPAYTAQAGLIHSHLSLSVSQRLTPRLRLGGFARISSVAGGANADSPLVRQNTGSTLGVGMTYTFLRSSALAVD
jgi:MipA family protein